MFVVEVGSVLTTISFIHDIMQEQGKAMLFSGQITLWLWFTVLFANFAEAMAEGRGNDQAGKNTEGPQLGIFGESPVNVLGLNLALDKK